jgi:DNA segregation ATPase FtsK/SpoIIIE, S-DNA-T family
MLKEWIAKQKAKAALLNVFKSGEIRISYKSGSKTHFIYPKIHSIKFDYNKKTLTYVFSLPTGLDPKTLKKKEFCFHQVFGKNIEIKGEIKTFVLTVFVSPIPSVLRYEYEQFETHFEGLKIPIICGIDGNGKIIAYDLIEHPHLLIAGETGSGKSTQLRSILTTIIQAKKPEEIELFLCDLKRSEFHIFRRVQHVKGVFVRPEELLSVLSSVRSEMKKRGDMLDEAELSHIDDLPEKLPYVIVAIDEVALLKKEKKIMEIIEEISAIGRALGVFLILSMQRPDAEVLDGKLKNNLTVRMGFRCADLINSRIIGTPGSEKLKEKGRMLLKLQSFEKLQEIQAPYLTIEEAKKILEGYKYQGEENQPERALDTLNSIHVKEDDIFGVLDE